MNAIAADANRILLPKFRRSRARIFFPPKPGFVWQAYPSHLPRRADANFRRAAAVMNARAKLSVPAPGPKISSGRKMPDSVFNPRKWRSRREWKFRSFARAEERYAGDYDFPVPNRNFVMPHVGEMYEARRQEIAAQGKRPPAPIVAHTAPAPAAKGPTAAIKSAARNLLSRLAPTRGGNGYTFSNDDEDDWYGYTGNPLIPQPQPS